eukprot:2888133-Rhodomonas_salina.3
MGRIIAIVLLQTLGFPMPRSAASINFSALLVAKCHQIPESFADFDGKLSVLDYPSTRGEIKFKSHRIGLGIPSQYH